MKKNRDTDTQGGDIRVTREAEIWVTSYHPGAITKLWSVPVR